MNAALLRLARRSPDGIRRWTVPGHSNPARLVPSHHTHPQWRAPAFHWPCPDPLYPGRECVQGLALWDLGRWGFAKTSARELLAKVQRRAADAMANP